MIRPARASDQERNLSLVEGEMNIVSDEIEFLESRLSDLIAFQLVLVNEHKSIVEQNSDPKPRDRP